MFITVGPKANENRRERIRKCYFKARDRYLKSLLEDKWHSNVKWIEYSLNTDLTLPDKYGHQYPISGGRFAKSHEELPTNAIICRYYDQFAFIKAFYNGWKRKYGAGDLG